MSIYPVLSEQAQQSSDDGKEATPVPIPNTEVKLFCADGSWGFPPVRVGRCWASNRKAVTGKPGNGLFLFYNSKKGLKISNKGKKEMR